MERKKIPDADIEIIRNMDKQLDSFIRMHHKVRKDFLRAESVLLREQGVCERELKTFVMGVSKSLEIAEEELASWRLDLETGEFTKESNEPPPPPEPEFVEPEEPKISKEQQAIQDIRKKYQR